MTPIQLKTLRARLGLTQLQLAERIGVTRNAVNLWEMGQRKISEPVSRLLATLRKKLKGMSMKRNQAGIARQTLLSFPGAALGAMLPSEIKEVERYLTGVLENTWQSGFDRGYAAAKQDAEMDRPFGSGFLGPR